MAESKNVAPAAGGAGAEDTKNTEVWSYNLPVNDKGEIKEFYVIEKPTNVVEGLTHMEYDIAKGAIAAPIVLITAPWVCAVEGAHDGEVWQEVSFMIPHILLTSSHTHHTYLHTHSLTHRTHASFSRFSLSPPPPPPHLIRTPPTASSALARALPAVCSVHLPW